MKKTLQLVLWIAVLQLVGYGMGMITDASVDPWYLALNKSSLTPPGYVFGVVWTILYVMIAITGWQLWLGARGEGVQALRWVFATQLFLNWLWTPLFFYLHWVGAALVCLIAIVGLTGIFLKLAYPKFKTLFFLMAPYWLWVCFASYLNLVIWH